MSQESSEHSETEEVVTQNTADKFDEDAQYTEKQNKTQHNMYWTPLCTNKHNTTCTGHHYVQFHPHHIV
jgi:hypothetical protein